MLLKSSIN